MFPSSGYFKSINCPFYDSGLCERPYCQFRHIRKEEPQTSFFSASTSLASLGNFGGVGSSIEQLVSEAVKRVISENNQLVNSLDVRRFQQALQASVATSASAIAEKYSAPSNQKKYFISPDVPAYKPTPIKLLEQAKASHPEGSGGNYSPTGYPSGSSSRYEAEASATNSRSNEYEPRPVSYSRARKPRAEAEQAELKFSSDEEEETVSASLEKSKFETPVSQYNPGVAVPSWVEYSPGEKKGTSLELDYQPGKIKSVQDTYTPTCDESLQLNLDYEPSKRTSAGSSGNATPVYEPSGNSAIVGTRLNEYVPSVTVPEQVYVPTMLKGSSSHVTSPEGYFEQLESGSEVSSTTADNLKDRLESSKLEENKNSEGKITGEHKSKHRGTSKSHKKDKKRDRSASKDRKDKKEKAKKRERSSSKSKDRKHLKENKSKGSDSKDKKKRERSKSRDRSHTKHSKSRRRDSKDKMKRERSESTESSDGREVKHKNTGSKDKHRTSSSKEISEHHGSYSKDEKKHERRDTRRDSRDRKKERNSSEEIKRDYKKEGEKEMPQSKEGKKDDKKHRDKEGRSSKESRMDARNCPEKVKITKEESSTEKKERSSSEQFDLLKSKEEERARKESTSKDKTKEVMEEGHPGVKETKGKSQMEVESVMEADDFEIDDHRPDASPGHEGDEFFPDLSMLEELDGIFEDLEEDDLNNEELMKQCYKIFQEYKPEAGNEVESQKKGKPQDAPTPAVEPAALGKKRMAHPGNTPVRQLGQPPQKLSKMSPAMMMQERLRLMKEIYILRKEASAAAQGLNDASPTVSSTSGPSTGGGRLKIPSKTRIAHVPNVQSLLKKPSTAHGVPAGKPPPPALSRYGHTNVKGTSRVAHMPTEAVLQRPIVEHDSSNKVPPNIRQRYLNIIIDHLLQTGLPDKDAFEQAVDEEKAAYSRSGTKPVYLNAIVSAINRLKKAAESAKTGGPPVGNNTVSHLQVIAGKPGARGSWSIEKQKKVPDQLSGSLFFRLLEKYILKAEELESNGFPMPDPAERGRAKMVKNTFRKKELPPLTDPYERRCDRCATIFGVNRKGLPLKKEECVYHWGKPVKRRGNGSVETKYSCCGCDIDSTGCSVGGSHVVEPCDLNSARGFVTTMPKSPPQDGDWGIYALDCEMCYTTAGIELTRITVIGTDCKTVYESLVKPDNPILDYNTRFSGIVEEDLIGVRTTIRDVQAVLLNKFSDKTIVMGHSLDSDFKALKLIHHTVIDTSVVFPHKMGPPYKKALRTLSGDILKKIIQNDVSGHDSAEDAIACMELMLWKVKEDLKMLR